MINPKFNPKKLSLLSANAVRKDKLNERITDKKTKSLVNNILKNNEGGLYHVNSHDECKKDRIYFECKKDRIYLMMYTNKINGDKFIVDESKYQTKYQTLYFIDQNALSEKQINEIKKEFVMDGSGCVIKRDCDNDIKYQKQFEEKIKELGVDLYVFDAYIQKKVRESFKSFKEFAEKAQIDISHINFEKFSEYFRKNYSDLIALQEKDLFPKFQEFAKEMNLNIDNLSEEKFNNVMQYSGNGFGINNQI
jgi:hypothetical protein